MNQRNLNRAALLRLVGQTRLKVELVQTRTSKKMHVKFDLAENKYQEIITRCHHAKSTATYPLMDVELWLEKNLQYGGPLVFWVNDELHTILNDVCRVCRDRSRYVSNRLLGNRRFFNR